jgi:hypothetical protein
MFRPKTRHRHALSFSAVTWCTALLPATALAQTTARPAPPPLAEALHGAAKNAYTAAAALFKQGDYAGAEGKYKEAYDLEKDPRLVFDMAVCERGLHHYARMAALLRRFKAEAAANMSDEDREKVDAALAAIPKYIGSVTVSVDSFGATVTVDGESVGVTPLGAPVWLDPGKHTVVVIREGYVTVERPISVIAGESTTLAIGLLADTGHQAPVATTGATAAPVAPPKGAGAGSGWRVLMLAGAGVAGAGVVAGGITGAMALSEASTFKNSCQGMLCPTSADHDKQSALSLGTVSTVAFVVAGVGATAFVVGLLGGQRPKQETVSFAPWIAPGAAGVAGSF